jgi:uncharacterized protein
MISGEPRPARPPRFKPRIALAAGLLATTGAVVYSRFVEPRTLLVRSFELELPSVPRDLDGVRIAFMSDFHFGGPGHFGPAVQTAFSILERERPDLILLGGDFYDRGVITGSAPDWSWFPKLAPTLAVPGNHDYRASERDAVSIFTTLENAAITVLRNETRTVALGGGGIDIIGVDDPYTRRADFEKADQCAPRTGNPRILLAHAGMVADELPVRAADLILSGHTHGGQVRTSPFKHSTPLDIFWWLDKIKTKPISPYRQGIFWVRGSLLYVGNGIGMTSVGNRFLAPPEIALFRIRSGNGDPQVACDRAERYVRRRDETRIWTQAVEDDREQCDGL